jgi:hypothetical protein
MKTEDLLLGFDARVARNAEHWDASRRETFLVRPEASDPFSTDTAVWQSVAGNDQRPPSCIGHQTLWDDWDCLQTFLASANVEPLVTIAVTVYLANQSGETLDVWKALAIDPNLQDPAWPLLGYDVSDQWLLSGLSNCGFLPGEDVGLFRTEWAHKLNDHHLLERLDDAVAFKYLSDQRTKEHSPFFVFGIWSVPVGLGWKHDMESVKRTAES